MGLFDRDGETAVAPEPMTAGTISPMPRWVELRLGYGEHPRDLYAAWEDDRLVPHGLPPHHFWDEPWWPGRYVVRATVYLDRRLITDQPGVDHWVYWADSPGSEDGDREAYGKDFEAAMKFFAASSHLERASKTKLVHCFLNARQMSQGAEMRWALLFALNRAWFVVMDPRAPWLWREGWLRLGRAVIALFGGKR